MKWILNKTSLGFIRVQDIEKCRRPILNIGALLHELGNSPSQLNFVIFYSSNSCNTCLESLGRHLSQLPQVIPGAVPHLKSLPWLMLVQREQEGWANSSNLWALSPKPEPVHTCGPLAGLRWETAEGKRTWWRAAKGKPRTTRKTAEPRVGRNSSEVAVQTGILFATLLTVTQLSLSINMISPCNLPHFEIRLAVKTGPLILSYILSHCSKSIFYYYFQKIFNVSEHLI